MCDYSLHAIPNRLAVEGERLVTHRFPSLSIGLASEFDLRKMTCRLRAGADRSWLSVLRGWLSPPPARPQAVPAVCVPPGARLLLSGIPEELRKELGVGAEEEVTFTQLTASAFRYRDAFRFKNGRAVLLQHFPEGVRAQVFSLTLAELEPEYQHEEVRVWMR